MHGIGVDFDGLGDVCSQKNHGTPHTILITSRDSSGSGGLGSSITGAWEVPGIIPAKNRNAQPGWPANITAHDS